MNTTHDPYANNTTLTGEEHTTLKDKKCVKCGEYEKAIRKYEMICGETDEYSGELICEYGRHRFKPYTKKELDMQLKRYRCGQCVMENNSGVCDRSDCINFWKSEK